MVCDPTVMIPALPLTLKPMLALSVEPPVYDRAKVPPLLIVMKSETSDAGTGMLPDPNQSSVPALMATLPVKMLLRTPVEPSCNVPKPSLMRLPPFD